ncbi:hypothetical protein H257_01618 [Aphanomyces astaci]|uniref:Uncharacterized protein n=1 Tax=Aphanomyces astaci TaxID=112090 RepID=W4H8I2_APHAT|nr:hypothetical protein H257_01618 [Aphanomyces astaci]ETV88355.1 hypothetical protein H257_01618 [Aphanomyces astaci]|eukprot:XP_009823218.1 hypothetical protein H257_01618 [Aphanomyces astaci]
MPGIKPDGAKALVRSSYNFNDKEIKFNISTFWGQMCDVLCSALPATGIKNKKRAETALAPKTVLAADVKQLQDSAIPPAAGAKCLTLEARTRNAGCCYGAVVAVADYLPHPSVVLCWSGKGPHYLSDYPSDYPNASEATKLANAKTERARSQLWRSSLKT